MATDINYAWMAAAAYNENRNNNNRVAVTSGWRQLTGLVTVNHASGFAAEVFKHSNAEVVIS